MSDFITVAELRIEAERLCDENERLEAENAKLRNDADLLRAMLSQVHTEKRCYMAENAKLRELSKRMARALGVGSNLCDRNCAWEFECDLETCPIEEAMRELGVEVDA